MKNVLRLYTYFYEKIIFITIFFLSVSMTFAQTQQGIVKTRGRVVDGQIVPGQKLTGATITLNIGNPLVSGNDGVFSFNVPSGKTYSLITAKKQGYTLADPEYTRRSFKYSDGNPFYVVLEDEAQRQADINAATRKVRRTLTTQLQAREDEIEALKEQNKLTEAEYQKRLQELYDNQSKSEQLVKEMAERYASTDYDQLDEFNRQVQMYIEEGELQKADSMIRSKGLFEARLARIQQFDQTNAQREEEIRMAQEDLEKSRALAAKEKEDLSNDLYNKSIIAQQQYDWDAVLYCMKMRADLDTTNVDAVWDYAGLCQSQSRFEECIDYWNICLRQNGGNLFIAAEINHNLGIIYNDLHDYAQCEMHYRYAIETFEALYALAPNDYRYYLATTQDCVGSYFQEHKKYQVAEKYYKLALENKMELFRHDPDAYRSSLAATLHNLGYLYMELRDYAQSENYYREALRNREKLFNKDPDSHRYDLTVTQDNLGILYHEIQDYRNSERFHKMALREQKVLYSQNPYAYSLILAYTLNNLGNLYCTTQDYTKSEINFKQALESILILFQQNPEAYRGDLAKTQNFLGVLYGKKGDYAPSEEFLKAALNNYQLLFDKYPDVYREEFARIQKNLGDLYNSMHNYEESEKYYLLALKRETVLFDNNPDLYRENLASTYSSLGSGYSKTR